MILLGIYMEYLGYRKAKLVLQKMVQGQWVRLKYKPVLLPKEDGTFEYYQKIVLESCKEHKLNGGKRY